MMHLRRFIGKRRHPFREGDRVQLRKHPGRVAAVVETWRAWDGIRCAGVIWEDDREGVVIHYLTSSLEIAKQGE